MPVDGLVRTCFVYDRVPGLHIPSCDILWRHCRIGATEVVVVCSNHRRQPLCYLNRSTILHFFGVCVLLFEKLKILRSLGCSGWSSIARCRDTSLYRAALCHDIVMLLGEGVRRRSVIISHLFPFVTIPSLPWVLLGFMVDFSDDSDIISCFLRRPFFGGGGFRDVRDPASHLTRQGIGCSSAIWDSDDDDGMASVIDGIPLFCASLPFLWHAPRCGCLYGRSCSTLGYGIARRPPAWPF